MASDTLGLKKRKARSSAVSFVIEQLTTAILNRELRPGDKLPTEYDLAEQMGVGRNGIREAIKILEFTGILEIRHSEGTFVTSGFKVELFNPMIYGMILKNGDSADIYNFRQSFEMGVIFMAMETATEEDILRCQQAFEELEDAFRNPKLSAEEMVEKDMAFHMSFCKAAKSELIIAVAEMIDHITRYSRIENMGKIIENHELEQSIHRHRNLLDTLQSKASGNIKKALLQCYEYWHEELNSLSSMDVVDQSLSH